MQGQHHRQAQGALFVDVEVRGAKETLADYVIRMDAASLRDEGVALPEEARGYVIFRQARVTPTQEDHVTTWTQGQFDRDSVIKALRKLDKVKDSTTSKRTAYFENAEDYKQEGIAPEDSDYDEEFVYMEQGDLQDVYEEGPPGPCDLPAGQKGNSGSHLCRAVLSHRPSEGEGKGKVICWQGWW